jgi:hypothetical protein
LTGLTQIRSYLNASEIILGVLIISFDDTIFAVDGVLVAGPRFVVPRQPASDGSHHATKIRAAVFIVLLGWVVVANFGDEIINAHTLRVERDADAATESSLTRALRRRWGEDFGK